MSEDFSPFRVCDYGDGKSPRLGLMLLDLWPTPDFVKRHGEFVNGHTWGVVLRRLVKRGAPQIAASLQFDPEAEMCVIRSDDRGALLLVARLLRELRATPADLDEAVERAKKRD